jgi:hypothetical protein
MEALVGPYQAILVVLALGGIAKVRRPAAFEVALRRLRVPAPRGSGRVTGLAEVALAAAAFVTGAPWAAMLVVAAYVLFTAVVVTSIRRGLDDCGCFGARSAPPSRIHVAVNAISAALAVLAVLWAPGSITAVFADQPLAGLPYLALVAIAGWFTVALTTTGAELGSLIAARPDSSARQARSAT